MANTLKFKRGLVAGIPTAALGEPLFTTDTFDLYIGNGTTNTRFQKYIASGTTSQLLRGDGSLLTMPIVLTSPSSGQVLKYDGTNWVNSSDAGVTGSGANGQVTFWNSASTITGSNNLFWDATNNRLGIGTNAPETFLHVNGSVFIGGVSTIGLQLENALTSIPSSNVRSIIANTSSSIVVAGALLLQPRTGVAAPILFSTEGSEKMRLTSLGRLLLGSTSDNGLRFQVTGDGYFSGSVGIGSTALTNRGLTIGRTMTGSTTGYGILQLNTIASDVTSSGINNYSLLATQAAAFTVTNAYNFFVADLSKGAGSTVTNQFGYYTANLTQGTNNYGFYGDIASGTGRWNLYMNGTAANYLAGDLSIGTTSPSPLVAGSRILEVSQAGDNFPAINISRTSGISYTNVTWRMFLASNANLHFRQNSTDRLILDASGNLGLGVTPSAWSGYGVPVIEMPSGGTLIGQGSVNVGSNWYYSGSSFLYKTSSNASYYSQNSGQHRWYNAPSGTAGNAITFTQAMTLFATGNLAVGTTTDAGFRLDVNGTMRVSGASTFGGNLNLPNTGEYYLQNAASTTFIGLNFDTPYIRFGVGGTVRAFMNATGLGLGTSSPAYRLDVQGTLGVSGASTFGGLMTISGSATTLMQITSTGSAAYLGMGDSSGSVVYLGSDDGSFLVQTPGSSYSNKLVINSAGAATFNSTISAAGQITGASGATEGKFNFLGYNGAYGGILSNTGLSSSYNAVYLYSNFNAARNGQGNSALPSYILELGGATPNNDSFSIQRSAAGSFTFSNLFKVDGTGAATFSSSVQAATAIAIGTTPDTNKPFKILKNINGTVGINFENTSTGSSAFSAIQMGTDVSGGTKFANLVYASSGVSASGVYQPDGTSLINNGSGGLNFLGTPIRFFTSTGNGTLRWLFDNEGAIQFTTTAPTTSATDGYKQYSADVVAGNAAPHFRTENGAVIKLYQETTGVGNAIFSQGGGNSVLDDSTFDGYTLRQIVKALRNQGILA